MRVAIIETQKAPQSSSQDMPEMQKHIINDTPTADPTTSDLLYPTDRVNLWIASTAKEDASNFEANPHFLV